MINHRTLGLFILFLAVAILLAGLLKIRYWIFMRGERGAAKSLGEKAVFRRRIIAGIFGIVLGIVTFFFGNF
ncbi:MAG: hypothetical protein AABY79_02235 [Nitrospirota bacterium]